MADPYFAPTYFPPSYFPQGGGPMPESGGGYFPGDYFGGGYFAPTYFPQASGGSPPADLPDDLVDAVTSLIEARLVEPGTLTWFGTGLAPPGQQLPYASLGEPDEDDDYWNTQGDGTSDGHLEITCFAGTKKAARALGDQVSALLKDAPLLFKAGRLIYLRQTGRTAMLDPEPSPGGDDCWDEVRQYHFIYAF